MPQAILWHGIKKYEWSVRIIIYSTKHSHFNDLDNRREFQYSDLFISNEFRAELILKTVPVHENIL